MVQQSPIYFSSGPLHDGISVLKNSTEALRAIHDILPSEESKDGGVVNTTARSIASLANILNEAAANTVAGIGAEDIDDSFVPAFNEGPAGRLASRGRRVGYAGAPPEPQRGQVSMETIKRAAKVKNPDPDVFTKQALLSAVAGIFTLAPEKRRKAYLALAKDIMDVADATPRQDEGEAEPGPEESYEEPADPGDPGTDNEEEPAAETVDPANETAD